MSQNEANTQIAALRDAVREQVGHSREKRACYRAFCLLMILQGQRLSEVASALGEHTRTLERWRKRFNEQGVAGLMDETSPGRPPRISAASMAALRHDIRQSPENFGIESALWHGKHLQTLLRQRYQLEFSLRQCQRLLKKLNTTPARPGKDRHAPRYAAGNNL